MPDAAEGLLRFRLAVRDITLHGGRDHIEKCLLRNRDAFTFQTQPRGREMPPLITIAITLALSVSSRCTRALGTTTSPPAML